MTDQPSTLTAEQEEIIRTITSPFAIQVGSVGDVVKIVRELDRKLVECMKLVLSVGEDSGPPHHVIRLFPFELETLIAAAEREAKDLPFFSYRAGLTREERGRRLDAMNVVVAKLRASKTGEITPVEASEEFTDEVMMFKAVETVTSPIISKIAACPECDTLNKQDREEIECSDCGTSLRLEIYAGQSLVWRRKVE